MKSNIVVCSFVITIFAGTLFSSTQSSYAIDTMDDWTAKRSLQRRSFLKSFCARRCNIGKGGNVCKCNGFHFAGKRTVSDSSVLLSDEQTPDVGNVATKDVIYKLLENNGKLRIQQDEYETMGGEDLVQRTYGPDIDNVYPSYRKGSIKNRFDPILEMMLQTFVYNDDE